MDRALDEREKPTNRRPGKKDALARLTVNAADMERVIAGPKSRRQGVAADGQLQTGGSPVRKGQDV